MCAAREGGHISLGVNTGTPIRGSAAYQGTWRRSGRGMATVVGGPFVRGSLLPRPRLIPHGGPARSKPGAACPTGGCLFTRSEILPDPGGRRVRSRCPRDHDIAVRRPPTPSEPADAVRRRVRGLAGHGAGPRAPFGPVSRDTGLPGFLHPLARPGPGGNVRHDGWAHGRSPRTMATGVKSRSPAAPDEGFTMYRTSARAASRTRPRGGPR